MNVKEILDLLPHRYPFLLVDRVLDFEKGEWIKAVKNVSINEPFFQGHFPGEPIMPGVLMLESMAQACGILGFLSIDEKGSDFTNYLLVGTDHLRIRKPVEPGDQLQIQARIILRKRNIWKFDCTGSVDGKTVIEGQLMVAKKVEKKGDV